LNPFLPLSASSLELARFKNSIFPKISSSRCSSNEF